MGRISIQYDIIKNALQGVTDNHTIRVYKRDVKEFASWARENGLQKEKLDKNIIQRYTDELVEKGYSPATVHRYIAPVCKGLGVSLAEINKPKRTADAITRSRSAEANQQGKKEAQNARFERVVEFQKAVGIRRAELRKLTVDCIKKDESGQDCILVKKGKGGKVQMQRVLPENIEIVREIIASSKTDRVFSDKEMNNKIDFHGMRADVAKSAYQYYKNRLETEPGYRKQLQIQLEKRWGSFQGNKPTAARKRYVHDIYDNRPYEIRGANKQLAMERGTPLIYDRLAVMAVSVFHLSHWRLDVTVTNYLV